MLRVFVTVHFSISLPSVLWKPELLEMKRAANHLNRNGVAI